MLTADNRLRTVRFTPYRKGQGPTFTLTTWDANGRCATGQHKVGYRLLMRTETGKVTKLFEGEDYGCAPSDAIDSDACVDGIMNFLTLRPGDTDAEYFDGYTDAQRDYCASYAETLSCEVGARFQCFECGSPASHVRTVDGYRRKVCDSHRKAW